MDVRCVYSVALKGERILNLDIVDVARGSAIALLLCNEQRYAIVDMLVDGLVEIVRPFNPHAVVGIPEQGIPLAHGVGRALGLDRSYMFRKTPKSFDHDPLSHSYWSVTKKREQTLYLSREQADELRGRDVAVVEDVMNTGGTLKAALFLLRQAGARVVGVFLVLTEGTQWKETLLMDANLVHALGHIPMFQPGSYAAVKEDDNGC